MAKKARVYDGTAWQELASAQTDLTAYSTTAQMNTALVGSVKQVLSTTKTDTFTMSSSTFADITGLSVTITPSSTNSKIYIIVNLVSGMNSSVTASNFLLVRNSTGICLGDTAGSRTRVTANAEINVNQAISVGMSFLDSPSTTSATTYKVQVRSTVNGQASLINRTSVDTDSAGGFRAASTITVMEVAG